MRPFTLARDLVDRLAAMHGEGLVSILIPTHRRGPETAQDRIRLKNAVTDVDDLMDRAGWRRPSREARLGLVRDLLDDEEFWAHQGHGLAIYVDDEGEIVPIAVGDPVDTTITVATAFHLRHLLMPLGRAPLQALVLTKGSVALFDVDVHGANQVEADLPRSMEDVNWFVDHEAQTQRHSDRAGSAGIQHGHDPSDRMQEDVERFLRAVSQAVGGGEEPLAVLGDDPVVDAFGRITRRTVIGLDLDGSDRAQTAAEVHRRVLPIIEQRFAERLAKHREQAAEAVGAGNTLTLFPALLEAAGAGRLAQVYVRRGAPPVWGRFDPDTLHTEVTDTKTVGTVDLVDRLVMVARSFGAEIRPTDEAVEGHDYVATARF